MDNTDSKTNKVENVKWHLFKKIAVLILLLFFTNKFFSWFWKDDYSGSIMGDSSDLNILMIDICILIGYIIYLGIEAIFLNEKKQTKLRDINICILIIIAFPILIIGLTFLL